ncbi:MAG TPA: HEAT repeat domain-containing protein [Blastocatellia bacterium]|nr:HEAT repeat domain-containing protein [Blastocatellia bacterium]
MTTQGGSNIPRPIPSQLLKAIREKSCALYAGAGFSLEARLPGGERLPTGGGLGFRFAKELYQEGHRASEPKPDEQFDFASLAEDYETAFGRQQLILLLHEIYAADGLSPAEAHHSAINYFPIIITTNYDSLFERASHLQGKEPVLIIRDKQISFAGAENRPTIYKIHGDLNDPERIIITKEDYRREPLPAGLREKLTSFLSEKTVLFIGCGLEDSDLQEVYYTVMDRLGKLMPRAFLVTPFPAEDSPERRQWDLFRKRWEQRGMQFLDGKAGEFLANLDASLSEKTDDSPLPSQPSEDFTARYLALLKEQINKVYILGESERRELQKVFVELTITEEYERPLHALYLGLMDSEMRRRRALFPERDEHRPEGSRDEKAVKRKVKPAELLRGRTQAIVTGAPGCGKTTLLRFLALQIITEEKEPKRLPIFLELKTVTEDDFKRAGNKLADLLFDKAVAGFLSLDAAQCEQFKKHFFARLAKGEVAIFLDGLDEVRGASFFNALCQSVNWFINSAYRENSVIISTRPYALQSRFESLKKMEINPLDERQIEEFLNHYYGNARLTERLLQAYRQSREMRELMSVPFLLGVLVRLHRDENQKIVAADRLELYRQVVQDLVVELDAEKLPQVPRFKLDDPQGLLKLDFLKWLACERLLVDEMNAEGDRRESERLIFTGDLLVEKARQFVGTQHLNRDPYLLAADAIATPLLREVGADVYAFVHLTIQEYLAAVSLASLAKREDREKLFFVAFFNTTLVEMEVLPMMLGLASDADALYTMIEQMPESLTYAGFRLRARGLGYGARVNKQHLTNFTDRLIGIVREEIVEDSPYLDKMSRSFSAPGTPSIDYIVNKIANLLSSDENSYVREGAAFTLAEIGGERAVIALIEILKNKDETNYIRVSMADALGEIGGGRAAAALIEALKDEDRYVRAGAADALGKIGGEQATVALIAALESEDSDVRMRAVDALRKIGDEQTVAALIKVLGRGNGYARESAAHALGKIGDERAVAALIEALKDRADDVCESAAYALGQIGGEQATVALIEALRGGNSYLHMTAAHALGKIGDERAAPVLTEVLKNKNKDIFIRASAAYALGKIGDERAVAALTEEVEGGNSYLRMTAAFALLEIKGEQAVAPLITALKVRDSYIRMKAAFALEKIGGERAAAALIEALKDEDDIVRESAAHALGKIGDGRAVAALIEALKDEDDSVRLGAADALGKIGDERAVAVLIGALKDEDSDVRGSAADALAKMSDELLTKGLAKALSYDDEFTRLKAALVIGYYNSDSYVIAELSRLAASDPSEKVRSAATKAKEEFLRKLQVLGKDAAKGLGRKAQPTAKPESQIHPKNKRARRGKKSSDER